MANEKRPTERHIPPQGMMNASGRHVTDLARGVMELLDEPFKQGLTADLAAHVLVACAVDLWRANYGDASVAPALKQAIDRRLEKPLGYWGGSFKPPQGRGS